VKTYTLSRKQ